MNNITRLEVQPRNIVDVDTADLDGRYSGGNSNRFSELELVHRMDLAAYNRGTRCSSGVPILNRQEVVQWAHRIHVELSHKTANSLAL